MKMWKLAAIICFFLSAIHDSVAPKWKIWPGKKKPTLPIITLEVKNIRYITQQQTFSYFQLKSGTKHKVLTDFNGQKIIAVMFAGQACSFVVQNGEEYEPGEVLITDDVARNIVLVADIDISLRDYPLGHKYWKKRSRFAIIPPGVLPETPMAPESPFSMRSHDSEQSINSHDSYASVHSIVSSRSPPAAYPL
ncbi:uncharacterized protein LOC117173732 [Belonocnema kinseyi]|uniref:uncharacterized protein LOC117173732 n=1 Tax=Belonocnema kinseyi TaxID=2817044 RepID=UPI00143DA155|nr:uncharacterized protein LOC117173732 [Belonocnema kinseyi]